MGEYTRILKELKGLREVRDDLKADLAAADQDSIFAEAIRQDLAMVNEDIADKADRLHNL